MKFKIGDEVFFASFDMREAWITCPDCLGKRALTVIMGDDLQVSIDCAGCGRGYEPPTGLITIYRHEPRVTIKKITGVEVCCDGKTNYKIECNYTIEEDRLFAKREDAEKKAEELALKFAEDEKFRMANLKEDRKRTWSWNATYHRGRIRDAERDLVYHRAKLEVAKFKAKEDKKEIEKS